MLKIDTLPTNLLTEDEATKIASLIEKATDGKLMSGDRPDWQKIMLVVDMLRLRPYLSQFSVQILRKILKYDNLDTVMLALNLLDSMTKNCSATLFFIADPDFVRTLYKLAMDLRKATKSKFTKWRKKSEAGDAWKKASIMEKSKLQIQALAENLGADPRFREFGLVYDRMLSEGVRFPLRTKDESEHIALPPLQRPTQHVVSPRPATLETKIGIPVNPTIIRGYGQLPHPVESQPGQIPQNHLNFEGRMFATTKVTAIEIIPKKRISGLKDKNLNLQDVALTLFDMLLASNGSAESVELMSYFYDKLTEELDELRQLVFILEDKEQIQKTLTVIDLGNDVLADFNGLLDGTRKRGAAVTKRKPLESSSNHETSEPHKTSEPQEMDLLNLVSESKQEDEKNIKEDTIEPCLSDESSIFELSENQNPEGVSRDSKVENEVDVEPLIRVDVSFLGVPTQAKRERSKRKSKKVGTESDLLGFHLDTLSQSSSCLPVKDSNAMAYKFEGRYSKSPPNSCTSEPARQPVNLQDGDELDFSSKFSRPLAVNSFEVFHKAKTTASSGHSCNSEKQEVNNLDPFGFFDSKSSQGERNPFESFGDSKSTGGVLTQEPFFGDSTVAQDGETHVGTTKSNEDHRVKLSPYDPFTIPNLRARSVEDNVDKTRSAPRPASLNPFDIMSFEPTSQSPKKAPRSKSAQGSVEGKPADFDPFAVFEN